MKRRFPAVTLILLSGLAVSAVAFGQQRLERLEVVLWPEYDRPAVLVMLRAELPPDDPLPAVVALPIPTIAGAPHAVAKQTSDGNLLVAKFTIEVDGDWSTVNLLTDVPSVRLEYYVPLTVSDSQRQHRFFWPGDLAIDNLSYEILHPADARNMTVTPPADGMREADSLTFYHATLGARSLGETFSVALAYAKSTDRLSSPAALAAPPMVATAVAREEEEDAAKDQVTSWSWLPLVLIGLAILVGLWLMFRRPPPTPTD